jgi:hypothetical protein
MPEENRPNDRQDVVGKDNGQILPHLKKWVILDYQPYFVSSKVETLEARTLP